MQGNTYLDILAETRGVVITSGLCVTESLENGVGGQYLPFDFAGLIKGNLRFCLVLCGWRVDGRKVPHDEFGLCTSKRMDRAEPEGTTLTDSVFPAPLWDREAKQCIDSRWEHAPLSRDNDGLASTISAHSGVCILRDGKQMWFEISPPPAVVSLNDFGAIECDTLEGVDSDENDSRICVDAVLGVTIANCMKDWSA